MFYVFENYLILLNKTVLSPLFKSCLPGNVLNIFFELFFITKVFCDLTIDTVTKQL